VKTSTDAARDARSAKCSDPAHIPSIINAHGGMSDQVVISFAYTSTAACQGVENAGGIAVDCNHGGATAVLPPISSPTSGSS
jgi:hypothetical protein